MAETVAAKPTSRRRGLGLIVHRFVQDRAATVCAVVLLGIVLGSVASNLFLTDAANRTSGEILTGPGWPHLMGTDELGRDLGLRLLVGAQSSLLVAAGSALLGLVVGVLIGLISGYYGRWIDALAMRLMDLLLAVPILLIALVVVVILGPSMVNVIIAIALANVPVFARLARASVLEQRQRDYVSAARAMGASDPDIMGRTILPNIVGPLIVQFVVTAASAVVVAASLSFLGLGVPPPAPNWGGMLHDSQSYLFDNPWYGVFPGLALTVAVLLLDRISGGLQLAFGTAIPRSRLLLRGR